MSSARRSAPRRAREPAVSHAVEALECRVLLSAVSVRGGVLVITGTDAADDVHVTRSIGAETGRNFGFVVTVNGEVTVVPEGPARISVGAGRGDDTVNLENVGAGVRARVEGGDGNDSIYGTPGADRLVGGWGDDVLFGGDGRDRLLGGAGNDELTGQAGNDVLSGGDGDDRLGHVGRAADSEAGRDVLQGGRGDDVLFGGDGRDRVRGGKGRDTFSESDDRAERRDRRSDEPVVPPAAVV